MKNFPERQLDDLQAQMARLTEESAERMREYRIWPQPDLVPSWGELTMYVPKVVELERVVLDIARIYKLAERFDLALYARDEPSDEYEYLLLNADYFCGLDCWNGVNGWVGIKPILQRLVGWEANAGEPRWGYDVAVDHLLELVPACRGCGCVFPDERAIPNVRRRSSTEEDGE